jgi:stage III sporulation protein SpoIIIAA
LESDLNLSRTITDDLDLLIDALAPHIGEPIRNQPDKHELLEVVMDLGRLPQARYPNREIVLSEREVTESDIEYVVSRISDFGEDNRAGIERTLHRISCIRNRRGRIVGLTCRVGRAIFGTIATIEDIVQSEQSMLVLGRPGVGKTTMLREIARVLADEAKKRVIIVDTSNEIAGDGDIPHPAIGSARRMQVATPQMQHAVMIEAVENHMPEVIVIDEIGTELEAQAARTIAERGVQLVGTAHGNTLENLMLNPTLADLVGGIQTVTLGDEEARRRGTQKSILERKAPPTFNVMVEIISRDEVSVHRDVAQTVDSILRGIAARPELRKRDESGELAIVNSVPAPAPASDPDQMGRLRRPAVREVPPAPMREVPHQVRTMLSPEPVIQAGLAPVTPLPRGRGTPQKPIRIFPFGVSRNRLEQAIAQTRIHATIVRDLREADIVITLKNYFRQKPAPIRDAETRGVSVYVLRANTIVQMENVLSSLMPAAPRPVEPTAPSRPERQQEPSNVLGALEEAEQAIGMVIEGAPPISLTPQESYIRKLQHQLADRYNLGSRSKGREPHRHVEIYRAGVK